MNDENELVAALTQATGSQRSALITAGISRSTWHYRSHPRQRISDPISHGDRAYRSRISAPDEERIATRIVAGWHQGVSVDHSFATAWDDAVMLASRRTWWRIAKRIEDQTARPVAPTRRGSKTPREVPVLKATGPNQIWSWDITDLRSPWRGVAFKAYSIIDIFSRKIVGCRVELREVDALAVDLFQATIDQHGAPKIVHADSGPAMRSTLLKDFLETEGVGQTHNRPHVSNDNPFSESEFRTMKYRPNYPGTFETIDEARAFIDRYVPWYNGQHKHSGIALFSPNEVHDGSWRIRWQTRHLAQQEYYQAHPERFRNRPRTPAPANIVGINLPKAEDALISDERLHAA